MPPLKILLRISARQLLGHPNFIPDTWTNFSRKAYVEPIVITDGHHDFVLMSAADYRDLTESQNPEPASTTPEPTPAEKPAPPKTRFVIEGARVPISMGWPSDQPNPNTSKPAPCRCDVAGRIVCTPQDRC